MATTHPKALQQLADRFDSTVFDLGRRRARVRLAGAGSEACDVVLDGRTARLVAADRGRPDALLTAGAGHVVGNRR